MRILAPRALLELLRDSARELLDGDPVELTLRLTLITLFLRPIGFWYHQVPIFILAAWALLSRRCRHSPLLW